MSELQPSVYAASVLRGLVVAALSNAVTAGTLTATIYSPGDTSTAAEQLPAVLVRSARQRKRQLTRGQFLYTSVVEIELQAQLEARTAPAAQDQIELMGQQIEAVFFTDPGLLGVIQAYPEINQQVRIASDGNQHNAELDMSWAIEVTERFWPVPGTPIAAVQADTQAPDPEGAVAPVGFEVRPGAA